VKAFDWFNLTDLDVTGLAWCEMGHSGDVGDADLLNGCGCGLAVSDESVR
jgi:hypothetical protein